VTVRAPTPLELELAEFEDDLEGPRVVAIGGGHGLSSALTAIRDYAATTTAIVSVADDGGSSGRLIDQLGIPAPGDIRRCLLALTPDSSVWSQLFAYRFEGADEGESELIDVGGHSLGNLIIAALTDLAGNFASAVNWAGALLGAVGEVIPAADQIAQLSAVIDGKVVDGQKAISHSHGTIERMRVGPEGVEAHPHAVEAIRLADQIVIAPGSLYTSVIAALAVPGIAEAVNVSGAPLLVVMNMVTEDAETLGMSGESHVDALERVGGLTRSGGIVVHEGPVPVSAPLDVVDIDRKWAADRGWEVVSADLADTEAPRAMHDPVKLRRVLASLL
jgi:uncharacterized cofD-like protein